MRSLILLVLILGIAERVSAQDWQLVWSDEFDTPGLPDSTKWNYDTGDLGYNQEWQYYTDRAENARVENGILIIEGHKEEYGGNHYTSARLVTRDRAAWLYGRIEARMRLPYGKGFWPAFWMLPEDSPYGGWPTGGEIDIMEYLGHDPYTVYGTLHYGGGDIGHRSTGTFFKIDAGAFDTEFHTFALEWGPRRMRWFVDGELYQTQISWSSAGGPFPAPFDWPFHIIINLAIGGQWPGYPDETTPFPSRVEVDYVRVYQDAVAYPEISLDAPAGGADVEEGGKIMMAATATDADSVTKVEFLQDGGLLAALYEPPYTYEIDGVVSGCYAIRARATNDAGFVTETDPAAITVGTGCPNGTTAPYLMKPASLPGSVEAEYFDLGGAGVAYSDLSSTNDGNGIRPNEGVDTDRSRDHGGGSDVTHVVAREWITYTVNATEGGRYRLLARIASENGSMIRLSIDDEDLFGDAAIPPTGSDGAYRNVTLGEFDMTAGLHVLKIEMRSSGLLLNRFIFQLKTGTSVESEPDRGDLELQLTPNPARGRAGVTYRLSDATPVELSLFDMLGRRLETRSSDMSLPGVHRDEFDLDSLPSGLYFCVLKTSGAVHTEQLAVVR